MPGIPQGRDIGESGSKSVSLVTVGDDKSIIVEACRTSVAQFERIDVDLTGIEDWRAFVGRMADELGRSRNNVESEHLVARLVLRGTTSFAWRIRRDMDLVRAQAEERAEALGRTWIDKVEVNVVNPTAGAKSPGALLELRDLIANEVTASLAYRQAMTGIMEELASQLPPECRHILGDDEAGMMRTLAKLTADGSENVLARLDERVSEDA